MEKLNRAQKCSILGPQNLGSGGGPGPRAPPLDPHLKLMNSFCFKNQSMFLHYHVMINTGNETTGTETQALTI